MTPKIFDNEETQRFIAIVLALIAFATIGGLLNYAYQTGEWFYGLIALANAGVYGYMFYKSFKG